MADAKAGRNPEASGFRVSRGKRGRISAGLSLAVANARDGGRILPWNEPDVALAEGLAAALDGAYLVSDVGLILKLSAEFRVALAGLPLGPAGVSEGGSVDGGTGGGEGAAWEQLVGAEPN